MFSQVAHDSKNNIYCWYDYRGVPSRWVEIKGRTFWKDENYERETLKQAASLGHFRAYPDIEKCAERGFVSGCWLTHLHPIGMGGGHRGYRFSNLSLMPEDLSRKFLFFMSGWYHGNLVRLRKTIAADGHKIFINVPILPIVTTLKDLPFLIPLMNKNEAQKHAQKTVEGHNIIMAMVECQKKMLPLSEMKRYAENNHLAQDIYPPFDLKMRIVNTHTFDGTKEHLSRITTKVRQGRMPFGGRSYE